MMRRWVLMVGIGVAALAVTLAVGLYVTRPGTAQQQTGAQQTAGRTPSSGASPAGVSALPAGFELGLAHDQNSLDTGGNADAVARAQAQIRRYGPAQELRLMGWGADNPEPSPGTYDWRSLDVRLALIKRLGGVPVMSLSAAPDWMKGGKAGSTDWDNLQTPPTRAHYSDFAALAVAFATRHPEVRYYEVWKSYWGFWNDDCNCWGYQNYTDLYNTVYDALKKHDPGLQIGGSDVPLDSWHESMGSDVASSVKGDWGTLDKRGLTATAYWLAHKHGAAFIVLGTDLYTHDGYLAGDAADKYRAIASWVKQRSTLPQWWSTVSAPTKAGSELMSPDRLTASLTALKDSGAAVAFFSGPQCDDPSYPCLWTATDSAAGGRPTGLAAVAASYSRR